MSPAVVLLRLSADGALTHPGSGGAVTSARHVMEMGGLPGRLKSRPESNALNRPVAVSTVKKSPPVHVCGAFWEYVAIIAGDRYAPVAHSVKAVREPQPPRQKRAAPLVCRYLGKSDS
jgi:hypothetical protein